MPRTGFECVRTRRSLARISDTAGGFFFRSRARKLYNPACFFPNCPTRDRPERSQSVYREEPPLPLHASILTFCNTLTGTRGNRFARTEHHVETGRAMAAGARTSTPDTGQVGPTGLTPIDGGYGQEVGRD